MSVSQFDLTASTRPPTGQPAGIVLPTLANARAGNRQRAFAATLCIGTAVLSAFLLPFVTHAMPLMPGFLAVNQAALVFVYGLTTWLFLVQFRRTRSVALLVLSSGSLYTTAMVLVQLVCFPGIFSAGLLLGEGAATLSWLWNLWHLGPPLFALPYAILERTERPALVRQPSVNRVMLWTIAGVSVAAVLVTVLATQYVDILPAVTDADGGYWMLTRSGIGPMLIMLTAGSLAALWWTTKLRTVLQLWLAVSLFFLLIDNIITDLGAARATMGWFVGRVEALVAGIVLLGVYLHEVDHLYRTAEQAAVDRDQARADAEAVRESLEIALEASDMGNWQLDLSTDTCRRTLRHDRLFGYTHLQRLWGRARLMEHIHPEDRAMAQAGFEAAMRDGRLAFECRILRADDGSLRWISVIGRGYCDAHGRPAAMAGCILDITDRKQTEAQLQQAQRMEAIGQLTGGVAHDFNNLLSILLGSLEMIIKLPEETDRVVRLARSAFQAGRRGAELTDKLLSFSRRQIVQEQTVNANRLLMEFTSLVQSAVGDAVLVECDLDPTLDPTRLDPNQLQATLLNLAGNARDAMPSGGRLRLETRNVVLDEAQAASIPEAVAGKFVRISVADNGVGMDARTTARAFEPFFTTKDIGKGTGLGLSQVHGFVRQAGGHCRMRSAPGAGCSVDMFLPIAAMEDPAAATPHTVPLKRADHGEVVLIVEDEDALRELSAESLSALGYGVLTAPDARIALDILRGPNRIDVLFSDIVMPGGMNGAQLAVEARTIRPNLKVLLTSGYNLTATGGARELPEGVRLLRKPYMPADLAEKLQGVISRGL